MYLDTDLKKLSIVKYLKESLQIKSTTSEKYKYLFIYAKMFDEIGSEAYSMDEHLLIKNTKLIIDKYKNSKTINKTLLSNWKDLTKEGWKTFLYRPEIISYTKPIHQKNITIARKSLEAELIKELAKENPDSKKITVLGNGLKHLGKENENSGSDFIYNEIIPTQYHYECKNQTCTNTINVYDKQPVKCTVCHTALTNFVI